MVEGEGRERANGGMMRVLGKGRRGWEKEERDMLEVRGCFEFMYQTGR